MKKRVLFTFLALTLSFTSLHSAFAQAGEMAPWGGVYYNKENGIMLNILNVAIRYHLDENGIAMFRAFFSDKNDNELCNTLAAFEDHDAREVVGVPYSFTISSDGRSIVVTAYEKDFKAEEGCNEALFGTYIDKH